MPNPAPKHPKSSSELTCENTSKSAGKCLLDSDSSKHSCGVSKHLTAVARRNIAVPSTHATATVWPAPVMHTSASVIGANTTFRTLMVHPDGSSPAMVSQLWRATKNPATAMSASQWAYLFTRAGYSVNGARAQRPDAPVALYRGATEAGRFGLAWSTERRVAERFARKPGSHLWTASVQPKHLLAYISHPRDPEHEYVVDPAGLGDHNVSRDGQASVPQPPPAAPVTGGMLWEARRDIRRAEAAIRRVSGTKSGRPMS